jgi:cation transporter-like permease
MICLVAANATASVPKMIATSIVGVLAFTAFLAWMMFRTVRTAERTERDPKYLRRRLIRWGMLYVVCAVVLLVEVVTGSQPKAMLLGLPIPALVAWRFFRTAVGVKIPPSLSSFP